MKSEVVMLQDDFTFLLKNIVREVTTFIFKKKKKTKPVLGMTPSPWKSSSQLTK